MKPTRQDIIDDLKNRIWKGRIQTLDQLKLEISCADYDGDEPIDEFEDILSPMEWNSCDRCGALGESDGDFLWYEGFEFNEDDEVEMRVAHTIENSWENGEYWSALCWECMNELKKKAQKVLKQEKEAEKLCAKVNKKGDNNE